MSDNNNEDESLKRASIQIKGQIEIIMNQLELMSSQLTRLKQLDILLEDNLSKEIEYRDADLESKISSILNKNITETLESKRKRRRSHHE